MEVVVRRKKSRPKGNKQPQQGKQEQSKQGQNQFLDGIVGKMVRITLLGGAHREVMGKLLAHDRFCLFIRVPETEKDVLVYKHAVSWIEAVE